MLAAKPFIDINCDDIISVLQPIWNTKTETARRIQQRLFLIFSFAKIRGWYDKDNPASWKEHLIHILPDPYKIQRVKHFSSLPYSRIIDFYRAARAPIPSAPVCATSGKPPTRLPLGGLVEQA